MVSITFRILCRPY